MYLHLGQQTVVRQRDIIGIFDMDNTTVSRNTRDFLTAVEKKGRTVTVSMELPKAFVVCSPKTKHSDNKMQEQVYITQMAPRTLYKRAESGLAEE